MIDLKLKTSNKRTLVEIFDGKVITSIYGKHFPNYSDVTLVFNNSCTARIWFDLIHLDDWEIAGALRVDEGILSDIKFSDSHKKMEIVENFCINRIEILSARVQVNKQGKELEVSSGLILHSVVGEYITLLSSPIGGAMDFGFNVPFQELDTEFTSDVYSKRYVSKQK